MKYATSSDTRLSRFDSGQTPNYFGDDVSGAHTVHNRLRFEAAKYRDGEKIMDQTGSTPASPFTMRPAGNKKPHPERAE